MLMDEEELKMNYSKEDIIHLLATSDKAVGRALVRLTRRQTPDEIRDQDTKWDNDRGFRPCHARLGQRDADYFSYYGNLTQEKLNFWRSRQKDGKMRISVYAGQLTRISNGWED